MIPLPPEFKTRLLDALRSGKYKQIQGYLQVNECFCILGVVNDVANPDNWIEAQGGYWLTRRNSRYVLTKEDVPPEVAASLFQKELGYVSKRRISGKLSGMNDGGATFEEIADWIEVNL